MGSLLALPSGYQFQTPKKRSWTSILPAWGLPNPEQEVLGLNPSFGACWVADPNPEEEVLDFNHSFLGLGGAPDPRGLGPQPSRSGFAAELER